MLRTQLVRSLRTASGRPAAPLAVAARAFHSTPATRLQNLFETPENPPLSVHKLTDKGFVLSDGLVVPGGAIFAEGKVFLWDVDPPLGDGSQGIDKAWKGWGVERFAVFERLVPRPGEWALHSRP